MQPLSISVQTFKKLREENRLYVDKTQYVHEVMDTGGCYFLSRPRRFGKSLFLSTLMELAEGNRPLFEGTWVADNWDWTRKYAVIYFEFSGMAYEEYGLKHAILEEFRRYYKRYNLPFESGDIKFLFRNLIDYLHENVGKVVFLADEYDKPLLDCIEHGDETNAETNRLTMKQFYGVLKSAEPHLHLIFITGITKFAKVSVFSDLNHIDDLTFDERFATAFGYTQTEMEATFMPYIDFFLEKNTEYTKPQLLLRMKEWYNGYSWDGKTTVYNPYGLLHFFKKRRFGNSWFESGTPTVLVQRMMQEQEFYVQSYKINLVDLNFHTLQKITFVPLLFQSGYLTIKSLDSDSNAVLDYPNREVRESFYRFLLIDNSIGTKNHIAPIFLLANAFRENDFYTAEKTIQQVFNDLPYDVYTDQTAPQVEGFYHGIMHILFNYLGIYIQSEVHTTNGRADAVVFTNTHIFIFEFKIGKSSKTAMKQLLDKDYASKYINSDKKIVLIGANFNKKTRRMDKWLVETK